MNFRRVLPIAILPFVLVGCGGKSTNNDKQYSGEQSKVAKVVTHLREGLQGHKASKVCDQLTTEYRAIITKASASNCDSQVKAAISDSDDFTLTASKITVGGKYAVVDLSSKANQPKRSIDLILTAQGWRVSSINSSK